MARRPKFTPSQDIAIATRYRSGATTIELAQEYGCSPPAISNALERQGVPRTPWKRTSRWIDTPITRAEVIADYRGGLSVRALAKARGVRTDVISSVLADAQIPLKPGGRRHPKFDAAQSQEIGRKYEAGATLAQLAKEYDTNSITLRSALRRVGVQTREATRPVLWTEERIEWLCEQHAEGRSQTEIARELGVSPSTISSRLRYMGLIEVARPTGPEHGSWRGGRSVQASGYVLVVVTEEDRPYCTPQSNNYVLEHRLVMGRELGRPLRDDETVHHINGLRADNRIENLQLRSGRHGKGAVRRCGDCGSHNIEDVPL